MDDNQSDASLPIGALLRVASDKIDGRHRRAAEIPRVPTSSIILKLAPFVVSNKGRLTRQIIRRTYCIQVCI